MRDFDQLWKAHENTLTDPLRWRKLRVARIDGDLFHESVPDEWIDQVFAVIALAPRHVFQSLTKRSRRMRDYCSDPRTPERIAAVILKNESGWPVYGWPQLAPLGNRAEESDPEFVRWPLPNVWLGVSCEDQARAEERIPDLLATPAAVRWVSAEPLLGPLCLSSLYIGREILKPLAGLTWYPTPPDWPTQGITARGAPKLDWIVVGGESGPGARPMSISGRAKSATNARLPTSRSFSSNGVSGAHLASTAAAPRGGLRSEIMNSIASCSIRSMTIRASSRSSARGRPWNASASAAPGACSTA